MLKGNRPMRAIGDRIMKKFFANIFRGLLRMLEDTEEIICETKPQEEIEQESTLEAKENVISLDDFKRKSRKGASKKKDKISITKTSSVNSVVTHGPKEWSKKHST